LRIARRSPGAGRHEIAASIAVQPLRFCLVAARRVDLARAIAHEIPAIVAPQALVACIIAALSDRF
jgi:hypothetical protein